jgi:hypothetical protein
MNVLLNFDRRKFLRWTRKRGGGECEWANVAAKVSGTNVLTLYRFQHGLGHVTF